MKPSYQERSTPALSQVEVAAGRPARPTHWRLLDRLDGPSPVAPTVFTRFVLSAPLRAPSLVSTQVRGKTRRRAALTPGRPSGTPQHAQNQPHPGTQPGCRQSDPPSRCPQVSHRPLRSGFPSGRWEQQLVSLLFRYSQEPHSGLQLFPDADPLCSPHTRSLPRPCSQETPRIGLRSPALSLLGRLGLQRFPPSPPPYPARPTPAWAAAAAAFSGRRLQPPVYSRGNLPGCSDLCTPIPEPSLPRTVGVSAPVGHPQDAPAPVRSHHRKPSDAFTVTI